MTITITSLINDCQCGDLKGFKDWTTTYQLDWCLFWRQCHTSRSNVPRV